MPKPLILFFDASVPPALRGILEAKDELFRLGSAEAADVVLFGTDEIAYVDRSPLYRAFAAKSLCITESDIPTFRLPGLYAANEASLLTARRTETISYFLSEVERPNPEVRALAGARHRKRYLYSFMGGANSWPRKRLIKLVRSGPDTLIEATHGYNHWRDDADREAQKQAQRARYAEVMAASKFVLCPRGCGLSSYRLFESMLLGVAPVIVSDRWRPISGIDWSFALVLREHQIPKIDAIVRSHEDEWIARGREAAAVYADRLAPSVIADAVHARLTVLLAAYDPVRERLAGAGVRLRSARRQAYWMAYGVGKRLLLRGFHLTGIDCPIPLVSPVEQQLKELRAKS